MSACHNFHPTSPCKSGSDADIAMPWKVCQSAPPPDYRGDFGRDPLRVKCDLILTSRWRRPGAARMWCIYVAWMKVFHFPKVVQDKWIENVRKWFKCVIFESDQTYHWIYFSTRTAKSRLVSIGQLQPQGVMSLVCGPGFSKAAILSWRKWCPQFPVGCLLVKGLVAWIHRGYWSNHIVNHMNDSYYIIFNMLASMSCRAFFAQTTRIAIKMDQIHRNLGHHQIAQNMPHRTLEKPAILSSAEEYPVISPLEVMALIAVDWCKLKFYDSIDIPRFYSLSTVVLSRAHFSHWHHGMRACISYEY